MGMPQFLEKGMKRERTKRFMNQELYRAMDDYYVNDASEDEIAKKNAILAKYGISDPYSDTRFYGVFIFGKDRRIKIDPIRYDKRIGLGEQQKEIMDKRKTHYFYPSKKIMRIIIATFSGARSQKSKANGKMNTNPLSMPRSPKSSRNNTRSGTIINLCVGSAVPQPQMLVLSGQL